MAALAQPSAPPRGAVTADESLDRPMPGTAETATLRQSAQSVSAGAMPADQRCQALEQLRARALQVLENARTQYAGKPLPLADDERRAWEEQIALWQSLYIGYALCTDIGPDPTSAATVWQRALESLGRAIREHAWAYRSVPASLWKELNNCYRAASGCELESIRVQGRADGEASLTCKSTFLSVVLHDAANCYALASEQMEALERWLSAWSEHVDLPASTPDGAPRPPLAIDLSGDAGARVARDLSPNEFMRFVDTSALGVKLRALAARLRENAPDTELAQTAAAMPRAALERLLTHLYVQWCSTGTGRIEERRDTSTRAQVAVTMHAVHFQISGRAFRQPGSRYTREEEHDLATFGHITERTEQRLLTGRSSALEPWEIVNQGLSGSLGIHRKPDLHSRIGHGQLVAVRTSSASDPVLATVQRLRIEADGSLYVGIRIIRGEARGVAVRMAGMPTEKYHRALLVREGDEKAPPTIIVSRGQFSPGALVEVHSNRGEVMQLGGLIECGCDFERLSLIPA